MGIRGQFSMGRGPQSTHSAHEAILIKTLFICFDLGGLFLGPRRMENEKRSLRLIPSWKNQSLHYLATAFFGNELEPPCTAVEGSTGHSVLLRTVRKAMAMVEFDRAMGRENGNWKSVRHFDSISVLSHIFYFG